MTDNDSASTYSQDPLDDTWLIDAANWWSDALQLAGKRFRQRLDTAAKAYAAQRSRKRPDPTDFDHHFREHALPKLHFWARFLGKRCAITRLTGSPWGADFGWSFEHCCSILMREALNLGAAEVSDLYALEEHLYDRLVAEIVAHQPENC